MLYSVAKCSLEDKLAPPVEGSCPRLSALIASLVEKACSLCCFLYLKKKNDHTHLLAGHLARTSEMTDLSLILQGLPVTDQRQQHRNGQWVCGSALGAEQQKVVKCRGDVAAGGV